MVEFNPRPLSKEDRQKYPNAIFKAETSSPADLALMAATFQTMKDAGYPIVFDFEKTHNSPVTKIRILTDNNERKELRAFSALYEGLQEATLLRNDANPPKTKHDVDEYYRLTYHLSKSLLTDFLGQPDLVERFNEYYAGLRWHTDQERIVNALFEFGTDYDETVVETLMSNSLVTNIAYTLDIPYERRGKMYEQKSTEILRRNPEIDYHRLRNPAFAKSPEGQQLATAYARACGNELARLYRNGEVRVTKDGKKISRSLIPLSRFPIIEALICSDLRYDGPHAKYDFGPTTFFDTIPYTDSVFAHNALVSVAITRLSEERKTNGMPSEGQDEFGHKASAIWPILRAYREYEHDDDIRKQLIQDILRIADAYDIDGVISLSVGNEYRKAYHESPKYADTKDSHSVRSIMTGLLTVMLASSDRELFGKASQIISRSLEANRMLVREVDPTILSRSDLIITCIDSLKYITDSMSPDALGRITTAVFESVNSGKRIQRFAEMQQRIDVLSNLPNVNRAWMELRKYSFSLHDEDPAYKKARADYDIQLQPATLLSRQLHSERNTFLTELLYSSLSNNDAKILDIFRELVHRIELSSFHMTSLPEEYSALVRLARHPKITTSQKNIILWYIAEQWKYLDGNSAHILIPVVMDFYNIVLGDPDTMTIPDQATSSCMAAVAHLVHNNPQIFKSATQEQLQVLSSYEDGLRRIAKMVAGNEFLTDSNHIHDNMASDHAGKDHDPNEWQKTTLREIQYVANELSQIAEVYHQYLRIEAVRVQPSKYYPWMLEKLVPFWEKIQLDNSDGYKPSPMMRDLYRFLYDNIKSRLVIQDEYPDAFDCIGEGHLDTFLEGLYPFMQDHDLGYYQSVWIEGHGFMHYAISYMPESLINEMMKKRPNSSLSKSLLSELKRREKENSETLL
jgi:hypothetical protein